MTPYIGAFIPLKQSVIVATDYFYRTVVIEIIISTSFKPDCSGQIMACRYLSTGIRLMRFTNPFSTPQG